MKLSLFLSVYICFSCFVASLYFVPGDLWAEGKGCPDAFVFLRVTRSWASQSPFLSLYVISLFFPLSSKYFQKNSVHFNIKKINYVEPFWMSALHVEFFSQIFPTSNSFSTHKDL